VMNSKNCMESCLEVDRLTEVYREYRERGWSETKWSITNKGNQAMLRERDQKLKQLLQSAGFLPLDNRRILDIGCGTGELLSGLQSWGAKPENLFGVDLLPDRIQRAKENFPQMNFRQVNAERLPFTDGCFDLVSVFTVFSSILDQRMTSNVSREIDRILRPGGAVIWYDFRFNSPFNPHVRGISRKTIRRLFTGFDSHLVSITLLPPLGRRLGRLTDGLYTSLASLAFLRSHYLGMLMKQ
jgi:ubiquinone/menaquinone biosynthesis C-methylase UbiE